MINANFYRTACKEGVGGVLGVKDSMIAHILGKNGHNPCANASNEAQNTAREEKKGKKKKREREDPGSGSENDGEKKKAKRKLLTTVQTTLKQSQLKVFRGIQVPFTKEQEAIVHEQFLRATTSANLPFRWVEDPEVISLFLLFRSTCKQCHALAPANFWPASRRCECGCHQTTGGSVTWRVRCFGI